MGQSRRQSSLVKSISKGVSRDPDRFKKTCWGQLVAFFTINGIKLIRYEPKLFNTLRHEAWELNEDDYQASFRPTNGQPPLKAMGDLGYSGSSLPRRFEYSFFEADFLEPYQKHMCEHPDSVLVWITDYILSPYVTMGTLFGLTPGHHIVMENILRGREDDPRRDEWETYDLKPIDYFYPERDLFPESLVSEETISKLADSFNDKLHLTREDHDKFWKAIQTDTQFLKDTNAVDYSLFLVRIPASSSPVALGRQSAWHAGLPSADGKWKYHAVVLDFFWARHKLHAQAMSGVVQTFNVIGRKGPMSITTTADEYRQNFLSMVKGMIVVD
ncbi:hypothetical protein N7468_008557 [Penicillium chermesinum]|uniref:PIPK domain-containing protein n=1 Tax=Penicillium chermesinum TaxID=63820 RepID=A0A9W9TJZ6_9EURO|nr:uncharacterized protein N7468_008557 [Penicillium chermesinum]KAJ5224015.1 hypothetical protein N7468_008557 [Penicillium chermesinum]